ncbi:extracellular solute-binding protein [Paenibacillus sp. NPDC056579]|uniref:ABC transporter substrate-binding protein n=1 Tax=Paenibacillus sp. NPDC056579 TaxID=3345871 RepID=UPI0036B104B9
MRNIVGSLLSTVLCATLLLTACTAKEEANPGTASDDKTPVVTPAGTFPIVKDKVNVKVLVRGNGSVVDFTTNEFTKWYEDKTNVHVEWEVAPEKGFQDKLNLMLASGDYPDVIMDMAVSPAQQMNYGKQGVFLPLNGYIEKYGIETKKIWEKMPFIKEAVTAPDGNIYDMPHINDCFHCTISRKMWIYKPWLDKLGLQVPTTTEEFYQVLKAFKEKDPNGNGKQDEIPLVSANNASGKIQIDGFLMSAFIVDDMSERMVLQNGKIDVVYNKPEWKEGLKYIHKLYEEKLIAPETFTQDSNQLKKLGTNPDAVIVGAMPMLSPAGLTSLELERWKDYVAVPPLKGPQGVRTTALFPYGGHKFGEFIVTKAAKYPEVAVRWADAMYAYDISMRSLVGVQDRDWEVAKPGLIGIDGNPAKWKQLTHLAFPQNVHWQQTGPSFRNSEMRLSQAREDKALDSDQEVLLYKETKTKYEPYAQKLENVVPPLFFSQEQSAEIADLSKTIGDYINQMTARFIIGDMDIDKGWDNYIKTLENMNLKKYLQIYQDAYDSKHKKK